MYGRIMLEQRELQGGRFVASDRCFQLELRWNLSFAQDSDEGYAGPDYHDPSNL